MKTKKLCDAVVGYINLGGVGFTVDSDILLKKRKTYNLKLKAVLTHRNIELDVKIMVIKMSQDGLDGFFCSAVYRNLTDSQMSGLKEISENFTGEFAEENKLDASIMASQMRERLTTTRISRERFLTAQVRLTPIRGMLPMPTLMTRLG
ncbi:hypothetical protein AGMMS49975_18690 [Clostridia bacterium]|nr:hypothetical protein AGMMS49975_18690 [Clostridia bacterium]